MDFLLASAKVGVWTWFGIKTAQTVYQVYKSFSTNAAKKSKSKFCSGNVRKKKRRAKPPRRRHFISKYLGRMKCIECGQEVTAVLNMEESSKFKCDDCWMDYDHGCDVDEDCEECRELAIWIHARRDVFRRITEGELDGGGTNEKSVPTDGLEREFDDATNEKKSATENDGTNEKSARTDESNVELIDESNGELEDGTNEKSAITERIEGEIDDGTNMSVPTDGDSCKSDEDCLICTECGAVTEVPAVVEDSSSFNCDDCLLGYQHGCDIRQDCDQCRDMVVWVKARREVVKKLKRRSD